MAPTNSPIICGQNGRPYRGLLATIYRAADGRDCTLGGISSRVQRVVICGPGIDPIFEATEDAPPMLVTPDGIGDGFHLVPAPEVSGGNGLPMFGGNFAATSDSRIRRATKADALRIHDRYE